MKKFSLAVLLFVVTLGSSLALAEGQIVVAADSGTGTYAKMLSEITSICATDEFNIVQAKGVTGGAVGNLDALFNNQAQAAFLHSDVYSYNANADSGYARINTLVSLYPEPIHVLALRNSKSKKRGTLSFGTQEFNSLADMSGYAIGSYGGGVLTSRLLQGQGQGGFQVVPYDSGDKAIEGLRNGEVAAVIFVGAAPLPNLLKLTKAEFKLLPIGEQIASRVTGIYRKAKINYSANGLTSGPIDTVAPIATLMTRKYTTPKMVAAQRNLRNCFNAHLDELKDNGSPNWQTVEAGDHGTLPWYELPGNSEQSASGKRGRK